MRYSIFILSSSLLLASDLSLQGFTGLINTPNAQVIDEGTTVFSFSNQFNNHLRNYDYTLPSVSEEDYMVGIGFLPNLEIVARLSEVDAFTPQRAKDIGFELRDLGANIKLKLPFKHKYLPDIAFGLQDPGSESSYYANAYGVMDKKIGFIRASLGYGKSGDNKVAKRMDGIFGGVEVEMLNWASLLAEHDGKENHVALRLSLPKTWSHTFNIHTTIAQNITESATSIAVNLSIPLNSPQKRVLPIAKQEKKKSLHTQPKETNPLLSQKPSPQKLSPSQIQGSLLRIQEQLKLIGFENIQIGKIKKTLYIKCENSIFDHNDLDALGVLLGIITQNSVKNQTYILTLLKNNLQILTVAGHTQYFRAYLQKDSPSNRVALIHDLKFYRTFDESNVSFLGDKTNSSFFKPRLELSPGLITTIGTEVGLFDYATSLRAKAYTTLYNGLTLSSLYEIPLNHSSNFDNDKTYGILYKDRLKNRLVNTLLNQTLHYGSFLNTTSIGRLQENYNGILNHTNLTTTSGEHGFNLRIGEFTHKDNDQDQRNIYLGSYRYFYAPLDLSTEVMYGQFWNQDKGEMIQFKRFFGDTSVSFYLKNTVETYAGFEFTLPLTWQKSPNSILGQIKGRKDFTYGIRTVVKSPKDANYINPGGAIIPRSDLELTTHYLNRDRLNSAYITTHLDRLRESALHHNE